MFEEGWDLELWGRRRLVTDDEFRKRDQNQGLRQWQAIGFGRWLEGFKERSAIVWFTFERGHPGCSVQYRLWKAEVEVGRQLRSCYRDSGRDEGGLDQNSTHRVVRSDQIQKCTLHFDIWISMWMSEVFGNCSSWVDLVVTSIKVTVSLLPLTLFPLVPGFWFYTSYRVCSKTCPCTRLPITLERSLAMWTMADLPGAFIHHLTHSRKWFTYFSDTATCIHSPSKWLIARSLLHSRFPEWQSDPSSRSSKSRRYISSIWNV